MTYVSVKLSDEAREVIMFKESRKKRGREGMRVPNHEATTSSAPRNDMISITIIHHLISLG